MLLLTARFLLVNHCYKKPNFPTLKNPGSMLIAQHAVCFYRLKKVDTPNSWTAEQPVLSFRAPAENILFSLMRAIITVSGEDVNSCYFFRKALDDFRLDYFPVSVRPSGSSCHLLPRGRCECTLSVICSLDIVGMGKTGCPSGGNCLYGSKLH